MVWGLIYGSWRHRIAEWISELGTLMVTSNELWQLSWIILNKSGFWFAELEDSDERGGDGRGTV
jgi:hypothetical protein